MERRLLAGRYSAGRRCERCGPCLGATAGPFVGLHARDRACMGHRLICALLSTPRAKTMCSHNGIEQLEGLGALTRLKILDIANNRIQRLEGLETLQVRLALNVARRLLCVVAGALRCVVGVGSGLWQHTSAALVLPFPAGPVPPPSVLCPLLRPAVAPHPTRPHPCS